MAFQLPFLILPDESAVKQSGIASRRAYERPPRCNTSLPKIAPSKSKSQSQKLQETLRPTPRSREVQETWSDDSTPSPFTPSTRASSAASSRVPSRHSSRSIEPSDGADCISESHGNVVELLRQTVIAQVEYPLDPFKVPSSPSRAPAPPKEPVCAPPPPKEPVCARPSPLKARAVRVQSSCTPRAPPAMEVHHRRVNAPSSRTTLVQNVKAAIKERKALRSRWVDAGHGVTCDADAADADAVDSDCSSDGSESLVDCSETLVAESHHHDASEEAPDAQVATLLPSSFSNLRVETENEDIIDVQACDVSPPAVSQLAELDVTEQHVRKPSLSPPQKPMSRCRARLRKRRAQALEEEFQLPSPDVRAAREAFLAYDRDGDGELNVCEFGSLLRDQGLAVTYPDVLDAIQLTVGQRSSAVSFDSFKQLFARGCKEEKLASERRQGFSAGDAEFLHAVFDKYDANHSLKLEGHELSRFLEDINKAPQNEEEQLKLRRQLEKVRGGVLGPVCFKHFLALLRLIDMEEQGEDEKQREEAANMAGLSKEEVRQLKQVFEDHAQGQETLGCSLVYEMLRHGLHLRAPNGEQEVKVRCMVESHAFNKDVAEGLNFLGFIAVVGDVMRDQGGSMDEEMTIAKFQVRSITSVVNPLTTLLKLQQTKD